MSDKKLILFDFDGTIANSLPVSIEIINRYAKDYMPEFKTLEPKDIERFKGMTAIQIIKEYRIPIYRLPFLIGRFQKELLREAYNIKLFAGMKEVMLELKDRGYKLGIVSSNAKPVLDSVINSRLPDIFEFIHSEKNIFGKHRVISHILKNRKMHAQDAVYVGDEIRDIEASRKVGMEMIAVTWGFNTKKVLQEYKPDFMIDKPEELLTLL